MGFMRPEVQVFSPRPRRNELRSFRFFYSIKNQSPSPLFLFRKKSACLFDCKRPHNGSLSLPTFCGFECISNHFAGFLLLPADMSPQVFYACGDFLKSHRRAHCAARRVPQRLCSRRLCGCKCSYDRWGMLSTFAIVNISFAVRWQFNGGVFY